MLTDQPDPADVASEALDTLIADLVDRQGLEMFDVLAGVNAALVQQMIGHMGLRDTEKFLCVNLDTVAQMADETAQAHRFDLVSMVPKGSA